jgi:hypothetical protein
MASLGRMEYQWDGVSQAMKTCYHLNGGRLLRDGVELQRVCVVKVRMPRGEMSEPGLVALAPLPSLLEEAVATDRMLENTSVPRR